MPQGFAEIALSREAPGALAQLVGRQKQQLGVFRRKSESALLFAIAPDFSADRPPHQKPNRRQ